MQKFDHCLLCESSRFRIIHQKDPWKYLLCRNCDLVSIWPRPSDNILIQKYKTYLSNNPETVTNWADMIKPVAAKSAQMIISKHGKRPGRLLDVGCGYGFFMKKMKSLGWDVEGIEISDTGRRYSRNTIHAPIHSRPLEELDLPENHFDAVTFIYVIEHISNPISVIKEVNRILKPGGLVLLRWPHSAPIVRILGPFSKRLDLFHTPYHLYDYSPKTIQRLLSIGSFEQIQTVVGGYTLPRAGLNRWSSILFGRLAEFFYKLSSKKVLIPGVSKTTMAAKPNR